MNIKEKSMNINTSLILVFFIYAVLTVLFFSNSIFGEGRLNYVDMVFPDTIYRTYEIYTSTWVVYGSRPNLEGIMRLPFMITLIKTAELFNLSMRSFLLILFTFPFFASGINMFFLSKYLLLKRRKDKNKLIEIIPSFLSGIFYMFNPFSLNRMWQYFFYPTYSFLPLIILMAFKVVNNFNKKNLFLLSFLSMIFSTSPLGVIWIFFIILSISIYFTAFEKNIEKTKILFYFLFFYLLFNLFWILPYILSSFERNVVPSYFGTPAFSSTQLGLFSEYSNFLDSIRLLSGWGIPMRDFYPISQFWILVSMIIPITIISFFLFQKNVSSLYFFLIFLITLFLSKGVNLPFSFFYEFLTFYIPQIGWVFRDPSRWLIMISISYSIFIGNLFFFIFNNRKFVHLKLYKYIILILFIFILIIFLFPIINFYSKNVYSSTKIPEEYIELNNFIKNSDEKALYHPSYKSGGYYPVWANNKRIGHFSITSLSLSNINNFQWLSSNNESIFYYIENDLFKNKYYEKIELKKEGIYHKIAKIMGAKYIILDTSLSYQISSTQYENSSYMINKLNKSELDLIKKYDFLYLYQNSLNTSLFNIPWIPIKIDSFDDLSYILSYKQIEGIEIYSIKNGYFNSNDSKFLSVLDLSSGVFKDDFEKNKNNWHKRYLDNSYEFSISNDSLTGNSSLLIENYNKNVYGIGWVDSKELRVESGEWIKFTTNMKYENTKWSHISIYGYNETENEWFQIIHNPSVKSGSSDWEEFSVFFPIPEDVEKIKISLAGGWAENNSSIGKAWFDDIKIWKLNETILNELINENHNKINNVKKINNIFYNIQVNSTSPFMLSFAESYDPLWAAKVKQPDGRWKEYEPVPLYSVINGFWIEDTGDLEITIEYKPQRWFYTGLIISLTTLTACISYLIYDWKKDFFKRICWKVIDAIKDRRKFKYSYKG